MTELQNYQQDRQLIHEKAQKGRFNLYYDFIDKVEAPSDDIQTVCYGSFLNCIGNFIGGFSLWIPCCRCWGFPYQTIPQSELGLVEKYGIYQRTKTPGLVWVNICTETLNRIDMKTQVVTLPALTIITKDNIICHCYANIYYRIVNPRKAFYHFKVIKPRQSPQFLNHLESGIREVSQSVIRNFCGQKDFQELISEKEDLAKKFEEYIQYHIKEWGVKVEICFIKDIIVYDKLAEDLSTAAKEKRISEAKVISAKADVDSATLMRQSADLLNTPAAMQIRYLETLQRIADSSNTRVIFIPQDEEMSEMNHKITQGLLNR